MSLDIGMTSQVDDLQKEITKLQQRNEANQQLLLVKENVMHRIIVEREETEKQHQLQLAQMRTEIDQMSATLEDQMRQLQQQGEELEELKASLEEERKLINPLRQEVQDNYITIQRLTTNLERSERAREQLQQFQRQYDHVLQISDDDLIMIGTSLGKGAYGGHNDKIINCLFVRACARVCARVWGVFVVSVAPSFESCI